MSKLDRVRRVNDPAQVGFLTGRDKLRRGKRLLQVHFPDGIRWEYETQLEIVGDSQLSPSDMLEAKKLGRPADLRRTLTHVKLSGRLADVIYSMEATNTDFYAYQFKPVLKILEAPTNAILIADEVGLGKTIEAGLIWTELRSRFDMRRLLVLCPAALREKWCRELSSKFGVDARISDAGDVLNALRREDAESRGFALVASTQGLRPPRNWEEGSNKRSSAELARFLRDKENEDRLIDLLVFDEAHHMRNPETQTNELGQLWRTVAEYTVFLTATPIHNHSEDLFFLLRQLDPDTFARIDTFAQILEANEPLVKARDLVLGRDLDIDKLRELLKKARSHPLLENSRQLSMIEEDDLVPDLAKRRDIRSRLAYRLEKVNLLAHVVARTRKRDVKEWTPVRQPKCEFVDLEAVERKFYDLVTDVVVKYAQERDASHRFLLTQPQRQMTSSMAASLRSWQTRLLELEEAEETGEREEDENRKQILGPLVAEIASRSRYYDVDYNELARADTKYARLREMLTNYLGENPSEKVLVFSTFRATLQYLDDRLQEDGISSIQLVGGQRESKDEIITRFRDSSGPSVLLSSEVGGEGIDLQFSHVLVNYDLPWNPMRLEQRIGRIDRIGQASQKLFIWNILYSDTIDARIYERLFEKLDLCRYALGDFEAILGDEIKKLTIDLLSQHLTPEQQNELIDQTAQAWANKRLQEQDLERDAANLVAYGDYILNQVTAARELNRWISGEDIYRYVSDHLQLHYPGCELRQISAQPSLFEVILSEQAKFELSEFIKNHSLSVATKLTSPASSSVRCRFENRIASSASSMEEVISQFHPLVRMVSQRIKEGGDQLTPAVALTLGLDDIDVSLTPGVYLLAATQWSFRALQTTEKLAYAAISMDRPKELLDPETAEKLASLAVARGRDWLEARNVVNLDQASEQANSVLLAHLDEMFEVFEQELGARNEDRAEIQLRTLDTHLRQQEAQLAVTRESLRSRGYSSLANATDGRILALRKRIEMERLRIKSGREVRSESREIALALIDIRRTR